MNLTPSFFKSIRELIVSARATVARGVDLVQVHTNFEIGRRIVQEEQKGKRRADYGKDVLKALAKKLTDEFGNGFSRSNLEYMRRFYLAYEDRTSRISQTASGKLGRGRILPSPTAKSTSGRKGQTASDQSAIVLTASGQFEIPQSLTGELASSPQSPPRPFSLSWSHYVFLLGIKNDDERSFYEIESTEQNWTLVELKRQFNTGLYERLALSRDKAGIRKLAREGQTISKPEDLLKEPLVLEFLGLDESARYSESELETAIINRIEHFLLELGKGFLFEARQKRFTFDEEHFFVDLVFYNRLLRCYVLIDLKIGKLTHQDIGQMQMYVNHFDRNVRRDGESATVGIILCKQKNKALVEITLPKGANIHAGEYQLYLPSKAQLKKKLIEWTAGR